MKKFRLLRADEIECRVQKCSEKGVSILLYKTARTDADLLDETCGTENWENDFKLVDGVLYGGIGVAYDGHMVWKWDAGTESNTEAEKGRASDAFKRAGFKHGIGRELYSAPFIWIESDKCNVKESKGRWVCNDDFVCTEISYDNQERVSGLVICVKGKEVYRFGSTGGKPEPAIPSDPPMRVDLSCADCGKEIFSYYDRNGKKVSASRHASGAYKKFGRYICLDCVKKIEGENG